MEFTYPGRIGSQELRLLKPLSASQRVLRFAILTVPRSLARGHTYTAVSYTWGEEEASEVIYLGDKAFSVRPNLWSCLYYLSLSERRSEWNYLWVDAICINQDDITERNLQVGAMGTTYGNAFCVSVWLGLPPLPDEYMPLLQGKDRAKTVEVDPFDWELYLSDLANRPYWSRFWVIQEFLLAINVELYCSNSKMDWSVFRDMLCHVADVNEVGGEEIPSRALDSYRALSLVMGRHPDKHPGILQPLHDLLIAHRRSVCKDPRDRVFALMGLIDQEERDLLSRLFPNYAITEEQVNIITIAHILYFDRFSGKRALNINSEVLLALGIKSKAKRKSLLRRAKRLDYVDMNTIDGALQSLEDLDEEMLDISEDEDELEPAPVCLGRSLKIGIGLVCLGAVGLVIWLYRPRVLNVFSG
ncbi:heterokaryon incompatibility protein-domain-containing protein [Hypomontagnella monticulosa]|nr:heterokaryon incompatibility protein-domain-containing protein [Hypomontagnella monticulosa]